MPPVGLASTNIPYEPSETVPTHVALIVRAFDHEPDGLLGEDVVSAPAINSDDEAQQVDRRSGPTSMCVQC